MPEHDSWKQGCLPDGEPLPGKTYRADGYMYYDPPKFTHEYWNKLLGVIGEGNYVLLTLATYGEDLIRGQMLISPEGQENCKKWIENNAQG